MSVAGRMLFEWQIIRTKRFTCDGLLLADE
jgi:hypothetical protein